jgi:hypothetical protein
MRHAAAANAVKEIAMMRREAWSGTGEFNRACNHIYTSLEYVFEGLRDFARTGCPSQKAGLVRSSLGITQ